MVPPVRVIFLGSAWAGLSSAMAELWWWLCGVEIQGGHVNAQNKISSSSRTAEVLSGQKNCFVLSGTQDKIEKR